MGHLRAKDLEIPFRLAFPIAVVVLPFSMLLVGLRLQDADAVCTCTFDYASILRRNILRGKSRRIESQRGTIFSMH